MTKMTMRERDGGQKGDNDDDDDDDDDDDNEYATIKWLWWWQWLWEREMGDEKRTTIKPDNWWQTEDNKDEMDDE